MLRKASGFQHADDKGIAVLSKAANRTWAVEEIEQRVQICKDPVGHGHLGNLRLGSFLPLLHDGSEQGKSH